MRSENIAKAAAVALVAARADDLVPVLFENRLDRAAALYWVGPDGEAVARSDPWRAGGVELHETRVGHRFEARAPSTGELLAVWRIGRATFECALARGAPRARAAVAVLRRRLELARARRAGARRTRSAGMCPSSLRPMEATEILVNEEAPSAEILVNEEPQRNHDPQRN